AAEMARTATRRYRRKYSNPKPLARTQNWLKLGGEVTSSTITQMGYVTGKPASGINGNLL
ncbi:hypothetical protein CN218_34310, partial [Sinorhizobium meliloti]